MKSATSFAIVLVTAPNIRIARKLAHAALNEKLIACANILPRVESHFWWQGKIESSREVMMVLKTRKPKLPKLEALIQELHPYNTPEIIALPLTSGNQRYLDWIQEETS